MNKNIINLHLLIFINDIISLGAERVFRKSLKFDDYKLSLHYYENTRASLN